jgi:hypothetical protein
VFVIGASHLRLECVMCSDVKEKFLLYCAHFYVMCLNEYDNWPLQCIALK